MLGECLFSKNFGDRFLDGPAVLLMIRDRLFLSMVGINKYVIIALL